MSVPKETGTAGTGRIECSTPNSCGTRDERGAATALTRHLARTALTAFALIAPEREPTTIRSALRQVTGTHDLKT